MRLECLVYHCEISFNLLGVIRKFAVDCGFGLYFCGRVMEGGAAAAREACLPADDGIARGGERAAAARSLPEDWAAKV